MFKGIIIYFHHHNKEKEATYSFKIKIKDYASLRLNQFLFVFFVSHSTFHISKKYFSYLGIFKRIYIYIYIYICSTLKKSNSNIN